MESCRSCCQGKPVQCLCSRRSPNFNCHKNQCSHNSKLVKDCICAEWSIPALQTQTIFHSSGHEHIFATGFVRFDDGDSDFVTVKFYLDGREIGLPINVFKDSSVAFSLTRFDRITIECSGDANLSEEVCEGEICLNTRVPV